MVARRSRVFTFAANLRSCCAGIDNKNYTATKTYERKYKQNRGNHLVSVFDLPQDAQYVRISLRKLENGEFKRGGYIFIPAQKVRSEVAVQKVLNLTAKVKTLERLATIHLQNKFENFASEKATAPIGTDTIYQLNQFMTYW